jgi:hypothetical protein
MKTVFTNSKGIFLGSEFFIQIILALMLKASNSFFWPHSIKGDDQFSLPSIQAKFSIQAKVRFFYPTHKK